MKISEVYKKYPVPNLLQQHHLRVAAVGTYICDNFKNADLINKNLIIKSLLLHDLGNVIKFEVENKDYFTPNEFKNGDFWKLQQQIFREKYHNNEHLATVDLVKRLGQEDVVSVLKRTGTHNLVKVLNTSDFNLKVVLYSDLRCAPLSVVSVDQRFDDLIKRYAGRSHRLANVNEVELMRKNTLILEDQLQKEIAVPLETITESKIKSLMTDLFEYIL